MLGLLRDFYAEHSVLIPSVIGGALVLAMLWMYRTRSVAIQLVFLAVLLTDAIVIFTRAYMEFQLCANAACSVTVNDFKTCLYFSVITITTVGYGDLTPTIAARPIAAIEALTGYIFFGMFVSLLSVFFATSRKKINKRLRRKWKKERAEREMRESQSDERN